MTPAELEIAMQRAGEARLSAADEWLWVEGEGEWAESHGEDMPVSPELAGPYCGCVTCMVREVLHAAWPFAYQLARHAEVDAP